MTYEQWEHLYEDFGTAELLRAADAGSEDQQGGGEVEVPDSWLAVIEEMRREGAPTVEEREERAAEAARLRLN